MKQLLRQFLPPIFIELYKKVSGKGPIIIKDEKYYADEYIENIKKRIKYNAEGEQDLDIYWDKDFAKILDTWGADNTWLEIQLLLANCNGKVLDIACGTGPVMEICKDFQNIDLYGCDISDLLLKRAHEERNIPNDKLIVEDATKMSYKDNEFNFSYSIGSLEHFTEDGIDKFISEAHRVTKIGSFHLVPTNEKGEDEGWISPLQSYYNNSIEWWLGHFKKSYNTVIVVKSKWHDPGRSYGHWFLCYKNLP